MDEPTKGRNKAEQYKDTRLALCYRDADALERLRADGLVTGRYWNPLLLNYIGLELARALHIKLA